MLEPQIRDLARDKNFATLSFHLPNGQIASHVMWIDADDEHLIINTDISRAKAKAMDHDPRVTIAVWDAADPYHYAEVRGHVVSATAGQPAADHIQFLAGKYVGGPYRFGPTDTRIVYRIAPDHQRMM